MTRVQPHQHPQSGQLDAHGNCPGCATYQAPERRARQYRLTYADGTTEDTTGTDAVLAVAARTRPERPVQVTDLTGIEEWAAARQAAREGASATRL